MSKAENFLNFLLLGYESFLNCEAAGLKFQLYNK